MARRDLILPFYLPAFLLAFGSGMLIPTLPLYLKSFGVSFTMVSVATAALGIGLIIGDLPAGSITQRVGLRRAMLIGAGILGCGMFATGLARLFAEIVLYRLVIGLGMSLWNISRHAYIAGATSVAERGRSLAVFGGVGRTGSFAGPAVGGFIAAHYGLRAPFFVHAAIAGVAALLILFFVRGQTKPQQVARGSHLVGMLMVLKQHARDLSTAGSAQMFAQMIRAGRRLIVPLYGAFELGLDPDKLGLIITASAAIDMLMFYPAGLIMDRAGRKRASVPCFSCSPSAWACSPSHTARRGLSSPRLSWDLGMDLARVQ